MRMRFGRPLSRRTLHEVSPAGVARNCGIGLVFLCMVALAQAPVASDAEKHELALRYARLVAGSRTFAAAASFAAKQKGAYDELATALKRYNEDVVKALKASPQNNIVNAQFLLCAELTAILFSDEEAELLRRRGRAALSTAA